jgi:hypothetical protein
MTLFSVKKYVFYQPSGDILNIELMYRASAKTRHLFLDSSSLSLKG